MPFNASLFLGLQLRSDIGGACLDSSEPSPLLSDVSGEAGYNVTHINARLEQRWGQNTAVFRTLLYLGLPT